MKLRYPELRQINGERYKDWVYTYRSQETKLYGAKLTENVVQSLARIIIAAAEIKLYDHGHRAVMQVHDELLYVVEDKLVDKFTLVLEKVLTAKVPWMPDLPIACDINHGDNYAQAK